MFIEIGNKSLKELTPENLIKIISIIGALPSPEFWNEPIALDFDDKLISDVVIIDYVSFRKSDNKRSQEYRFFLNIKDFYWHYTKDYERVGVNQRHHTQHFSLSVWKYLISQGFDIPLYNNA